MNPIEVIQPDSAIDSNFEEFEYLIEWYSTKGACYRYMFTDWENSENQRNDILNEFSPGKIRNLPNREDRAIEVTFEDIPLTDLKEYLTIKKAILINRVFKDGSRERLAIEGGTKNWPQTNIRYNLTVILIPYSRKLPQ